MKKIIYKIIQKIRDWSYKQEQKYQQAYIEGVCKRLHCNFPECKFKCYYNDDNLNIYYIDITDSSPEIEKFLDEERNTMAAFNAEFTFYYETLRRCTSVIYEIK